MDFAKHIFVESFKQTFVLKSKKFVAILRVKYYFNIFWRVIMQGKFLEFRNFLRLSEYSNFM